MRASIVWAAMITPDSDGLVLTDAVDTVDGLGLLGVDPAQLCQHDVGGNLQVESDTRRGQ